MIPPELTSLDRWVCALNGSKAPMKAFEFKGASVSRPEDWADYECARQSVANGVYDNVGFVLAGDGIVGIDIDKGFDDDGVITDLALGIITSCLSYTEYSRSGRGFHIFVKGDLPFDGRNNHAGVEIYRSGRYFITTGNVFMYDRIISNQNAIDDVLARHFADVMSERQTDSARNPRVYSPVWTRHEGRRLSLRPDYPPIGEGGRNLSLTSLAGQLRSVGYTKKQIYGELIRANGIACTPPLERSELMQIADSVMRYSR